MQTKLSLQNPGYLKAETWFNSLGWTPLDFQKDTWKAYQSNKSGMINAPTGSGKTYSVLLAELTEAMIEEQEGKGFTPAGLLFSAMGHPRNIY